MKLSTFNLVSTKFQLDFTNFLMKHRCLFLTMQDLIIQNTGVSVILSIPTFPMYLSLEFLCEFLKGINTKLTLIAYLNTFCTRFTSVNRVKTNQKNDHNFKKNTRKKINGQNNGLVHARISLETFFFVYLCLS